MIKIILVLVTLLSFIEAKDLGIHEKLGQNVPLNLKFINEENKEVTLEQLIDNKPTLLTLNYFKCAGICTPQLNDLAKMLGRVHLAENTDYKVISVSFAENESYKLAAAKRKNLLASMTRSYVADAWHFVIGENNSSLKLAESIGFSFKKVINPAGDVGYIHAAVLVVLSPKGKIIRYMDGIEQLPADITMAIHEAKKGTVRQSIPKNSPYCFTETPQGDEYFSEGGKIWAIFTLFVLASLLFYLIKTTKRNKDNS